MLNGGRHSPILYGWTEGMPVRVMLWPSWRRRLFPVPHQPDGIAVFQGRDWPDGGDASQEEPACGAHYQPYGPIELNHVTAMISDVALTACSVRQPIPSVA